MSQRRSWYQYLAPILLLVVTMCLPPATGGRVAMCVLVVPPRRPSPEVREAAGVFVRVTAEYNFIAVHSGKVRGVRRT